MNAAVKPPHVFAAICGVMEGLAKEGISKDRRNPQQGYNFRGIDDVYNALAPFLAKHKLVITPRCLERTCVERQTQKGGALFYVTVDMEFVLTSAEDGSTIVARTFGEAMDSADKATNKAMSAAYKYACLQAFAIPTEGDGDNDADATTHEVVHRPQGVSNGHTPSSAPPAGGPHQNGSANRVAEHLPTGPSNLLGIADADRVVALMAKAAALPDLEFVASKHIAGRQWQQPALDYLRGQFRQHRHRIETSQHMPPVLDDIPFE